jgi:hypothetical protein
MTLFINDWPLLRRAGFGVASPTLFQLWVIIAGAFKMTLSLFSIDPASSCDPGWKVVLGLIVLERTAIF